MIYVYTKENCVQCERAKAFYDLKGVDYKVVDDYPQSCLSEWRSCGVSSFPVIYKDDDLLGSGSYMSVLFESIKA